MREYVENLEVIPLSADHRESFAVATDLIHRCEGKGACSDTHVERCALLDQRIAMGAFSENQLVGISTGQVLPDENRGIVVHISVEKAFRKQGIGLRLMLSQLDFFRRQGCSIVSGYSWANKSTDTSKSIFVRSGFEQVKILENFYSDSLKKSGLSCPICVSECNCSAILYVKQLE